MKEIKKLSGAEILDKILDELQVSLSEFARKVGLPYRSLYDIKANRIKKITRSVAYAINRAYPDYTIEYLLTGENNTIDGNSVKKVYNIIEGGNHNMLGGNITPLVKEMAQQREDYVKNIERLLDIIEKQNEQINQLINK